MHNRDSVKTQLSWLFKCKRRVPAMHKIPFSESGTGTGGRQALEKGVSVVATGCPFASEPALPLFLLCFLPAPEVSGGFRRRAVAGGVPHQQKVGQALWAETPAWD